MAFYNAVQLDAAEQRAEPVAGLAAALFLTARGSRETHAVTLSDGRVNGGRHAGKPYRGISWADILKRVDNPAAVEKNDAPFVIPSTYRECEGRSHTVQREHGDFWFLAIDIDRDNVRLDVLVEAVAAVTGNAQASFYSSSSAAADCRKWRGLIPLASPVSGADYRDTQKALYDLLLVRGVRCDYALARTAQPIYLPNVPPTRRGSDGRPLFYVSHHAAGPLLDLTAGTEIVEAREAARARDEAARVRRKARWRQHPDDGQLDARQRFDLNNSVASCLADYGFARRGDADDYRSPVSTSGSYSTRDMGDYWVAVSAWARDHDVGRESENGNRYGDAFDLYVFFEHGGDRRAAYATYAEELGLRPAPLDDLEPVIVEAQPDRGPVRSLDEWREEVAVERALAVRMPGLHLDRSPTGSGKTYATTRAIADAIRSTRREAEYDDSVVVIERTLTVLPDHANIRERVAEMQAAGLDAAAYPARDETTCGNLEAVRRTEALGLVAGAAVCPDCELSRTCLYNQQLKQAEQAAHAIGTHERLRLSPARTTRDRQVVVIDETPEAVLAPSITVMVEDFAPVVALASTVRDDFLFRGRVVEPDTSERSFAAALVDAYSVIADAAAAASEAGVVQIALPSAAIVPLNWQRTLLRWADEIGVNPSRDRVKRERFQKAIRLLTMIVTGKVEQLHLLVDQTRRHEEQPDGTVREWSPLHHFVVGSWKTPLPNVPVICLDATATADDLRAAAGREVHDCTPHGHLPNVAPVIQIPRAIDQSTSSRTVAGHVADLLNAHPEMKRVGLIGLKCHIDEIMDDDRLLPRHLRDRLAMASYYYSGLDRASNQWYADCDAMLLVGTPYPGGGPVRQRLVIHGRREAAARPGNWGIRHWAATTISGREIVVEGRGYRDPEWHEAHAGIVRAAMLQGGGRGRSILDTGKPTYFISDEPVAGALVDDSVATSAWADREAVEAVRALRDGTAATSLFPIDTRYRKKSGSRMLVRVSAVIEYMRAITLGDGGRLGRSGAEKRLRDARRSGLLESPEKGWVAVADDEPAVVPVDEPLVASAPTQPSVVISVTGPSTASTSVDVVAVAQPGITTSVSTTTVPADPAPSTSDLVELAEERAAIMEFDGGLDRHTAERMAGEMLRGRGVSWPLVPAEPVGVDHVTLAARLHPLVNAAVGRFGGTVTLISPDDDPFSRGWGVRAIALPRPAGEVCRCGSTEWNHVLIHDGQSERADCKRCGRFGRFTRWYGKPSQPVAEPAMLSFAVDDVVHSSPATSPS